MYVTVSEWPEATWHVGALGCYFWGTSVVRKGQVHIGRFNSTLGTSWDASTVHEGRRYRALHMCGFRTLCTFVYHSIVPAVTPYPIQHDITMTQHDIALLNGLGFKPC